MDYQLAQVNVARLLHNVDHPRLKPFVDGLDAVNAASERSPGFVWRLQDEAGNATSFHLYDDPRRIVNLSVWTDADSLMAFVQSALHMSFLKRRREWFEKPSGAYAALWWVRAGYRPTVDEAQQRLESLDAAGATAFAFSFRQPYPSPHATDGSR